MTPCIVALGSNIGDLIDNLDRAVSALEMSFKVIAVSEFIVTKPMYLANQPNFLNACVKILSPFGPRMTLGKLMDIEDSMGRKREVSKGPRIIDLDLISYGSLIYRFNLHSGYVHLPHQRAHERNFVLNPWRQIDPVTESEYHEVLKKRPTW